MGRSERQRLNNKKKRTNYRAVSPEEKERRRKNSSMDRKRYNEAMEEAKIRVCKGCYEKNTRSCVKCQKLKKQAIFLYQYLDVITPKRDL